MSDESPSLPSCEGAAKKLPEFAVKEDGTCVLRLVSDAMISDAFGGTSIAFATERAHDCLQLAGGKTTDVHDGNRALGIAIEIKPKDAVEALLATQMAATHTAMMRFSMLMANAQTTPQFEFLERATSKLARTFTTQMEALRKHRNGGNQTVTVQHVNVADGGQAIVGAVQAGGKDEK